MLILDEKAVRGTCFRGLFMCGTALLATLWLTGCPEPVGRDADGAGGLDAAADAAVDVGDDSDASDSSSDADGRVDVNAASDPESYEKAIRREAFCSQLLDCESKIGVLRFFELFCHPEAPRELEIFRVSTSARGKRYEFDEQKAKRCLETWLRSDQCEGYSSVTANTTPFGEPPCSEVFVGKQFEGDSCTDTVECKGKLRCVLGRSCPGTCRKPAGEGEPCGSEPGCAAGLYCDGNETCQTTRSLGESCTGKAECGAGLFCGSKKLCVRNPEEKGDSCKRTPAGDNCPGEWVCRQGECRSGSPIGSPCSDDIPCTPSGRCVRGTCLEVVGPGESCKGSKTCILSHYCKAGTCVPRPTSGESCRDSSQYWTTPRRNLCYTGTCSSGRCRLAQSGDSCANFRYSMRSCRDSYCRFQTKKCETIKMQGDVCDQDRECDGQLICRQSGSDRSECLPLCEGA